MDPGFWLERWAKHEIGFHQRHVNEYLIAHWPRLEVADAATVFVPLCGKSLDMRWLSERGHRVLGVEISRTACSEFFAEWNASPEVERSGAFERWSAREVTLLCGDFFDLQREDMTEVRAVFDRAALIALPPSMRRAYAAKLREILPAGTPLLLVAPDYDQSQMKGPPFAVGPSEIRELFGVSCVDELGAYDVSDAPDNARFRQRGLTSLIERVFRIDF
jgi:thiopurine S-methyltransferase